MSFRCDGLWQCDDIMNHKISRRQFAQYLGRGTIVFGAISGLGISSFRAFADSAVSGAFEKTITETLVQYAYFILPVLEPTHSRYRAVADKITGQAGQVPELASLLESGIAALNAADKVEWLGLPTQEKATIVNGLAGTPFFGYLRWIASEIVMRDPALWETLGYQGSSIEHGGYLYRGFDDIDWLPQSGQGM
jgi:hypothetical protein